MERNGGGLDYLETPRKDLPQAVVDGKGTPSLNDDMAKLAQRVSFCEPEHFQRHVTHQPLRHRPGEISKMRLGYLVIKGLVGYRGAKEGIEAAVEIRDRLDPPAGTGCRQRQAQAKGRHDSLASTQLHVLAAGVEQGFGKAPLELVSDHAQLSVIHRRLLSLFPKQHAQEECRMDRHKNPQ